LGKEYKQNVNLTFKIGDVKDIDNLRNETDDE
jgi:hypothetical protein